MGEILRSFLVTRARMQSMSAEDYSQQIRVRKEMAALAPFVKPAPFAAKGGLLLKPYQPGLVVKQSAQPKQIHFSADKQK